MADAPDRKAVFKKDYDRVHDKITATVDQVDALLKAPKSRELIGLIRSTGSQYLAFSDDVVALGMAGKRDEAAQLLLGPRYQTQVDYLQAISDLVSFQVQQMQQARSAQCNDKAEHW
ncbi:MCP four helix bundle domain-containing protein [Pantoea agglomerans]|uniref:MCP four helix bundle domain-containing protein n=1 Tax=Enterobacter agglomerans TaxID=549 RepID=UPI001FD98B64|nr:MCP four helix bundle domain-containing protein [Pantoea agglomerans]